MPNLDSCLPVAALLRLLALTRELAVPNPMSGLLRLIVDAGRDILGAEQGVVLLYDAIRHELQPVAEQQWVNRYLAEERPGGFASRAAPAWHGVSEGRGIAGISARKRRTVNVVDVGADPAFDGDIDRAAGAHPRPLLSVPLLAQGDELVGVLQFTSPVRGAFDSADENVAEVLARHAATAIQHERLRVGFLLRLKMERDLEAARSIQEGVLPATLPRPKGYTISAISRPAEQTGGDIYDVIWMGTPDKSPLALLLADASGHGIGPALSVVQVRAMLRVGLRLGATLVNIVRQIDSQLVDDLADDQFVTAFVGCLDPSTHQLAYHSAGQGPLLHYHAADARAEWHGATALPLGVSEFSASGTLACMALELGDFVVLLTDGFYECTDGSGAMFGRERVAEVTSRHLDLGARALLDALVQEVDRFSGGVVQADDLTAIVVQRTEWAEAA